jgi:hypothetical protein
VPSFLLARSPNPMQSSIPLFANDPFIVVEPRLACSAIVNQGSWL